MAFIGTQPRLLFILGDIRAGRAEDLTPHVQVEAETVRDGGMFSPEWERVLRPLGAWSYAVQKRVRDLLLIDDVAAAAGLRDISVLSLGRATEADVEMVRETIERERPDLVVCAGCETAYWPLVDQLALGCELLTTEYGVPLHYSLLQSRGGPVAVLQFWNPLQGYHTEGGHHRLFKLFLHAFDALCRKSLVSCR